MDYISILTLAAKKVGVVSILLIAICTKETNLKNITTPNDHGTPSFGLCQIKKGSAKLVGFKGKDKDLENPQINALYAARYLKMQIDRYNDFCKAVAAYNSGSYYENKKKLGYPKNLKYVQDVRNLIKEQTVSMLLECNMFEPKITKRYNLRRAM